MDEFDIGDGGSGAECAGHAIAGGDVWIGGVFKDAAETAGGEQDGAGLDEDHAAGFFFEGGDTGDFTVFGQQVGNSGEGLKGDAVGRAGALAKGANDFASGGVTVSMQNAATAVGAFARESEPGALAIELSAPCDQLLDGGRTFFDQGANCFGIAEAVAGNEGVLLVQFDLIVVAESRSYASLRIFGGRFLQTVFGDDKHPAGRGELNCGAETCNAGPYDDVIRTDVFGSGDMSMIALREIRGMVLR